MRKLLLVASVLVAAIAAMPASAEETIVCSDTAPQICAGLDQTDGDDYDNTFVVAWIEHDGAFVYGFGGTETIESASYRGTGACAWAETEDLFEGGCAVLFQEGDYTYVYLVATPTGSCYVIDSESISEC